MELNNALRASVHQILKNAAAFFSPRNEATGNGWSLQGLGMLRLYLSREVRLHVWDSRFVAGDVSVIHTHPWNFESYVVSGEVRQFRYFEDEKVGGLPMNRQKIQCGPTGCAMGDPEEVKLYRSTLETYVAGTSYSQLAAEIHESLPVPGTVTIVERKFLEDTEHAFVYYRGEKWGEATPRPATPEEVDAIVGLALQRWGR